MRRKKYVFPVGGFYRALQALDYNSNDIRALLGGGWHHSRKLGMRPELLTILQARKLAAVFGISLAEFCEKYVPENMGKLGEKNTGKRDIFYGEFKQAIEAKKPIKKGK